MCSLETFSENQDFIISSPLQNQNDGTTNQGLSFVYKAEVMRVFMFVASLTDNKQTLKQLTRSVVIEK